MAGQPYRVTPGVRRQLGLPARQLGKVRQPVEPRQRQRHWRKPTCQPRLPRLQQPIDSGQAFPIARRYGRVPRRPRSACRAGGLRNGGQLRGSPRRRG
jgi:hypothetical protein